MGEDRVPSALNALSFVFNQGDRRGTARGLVMIQRLQSFFKARDMVRRLGNSPHYDMLDNRHLFPRVTRKDMERAERLIDSFAITHGVDLFSHHVLVAAAVGLVSRDKAFLTNAMSWWGTVALDDVKWEAIANCQALMKEIELNAHQQMVQDAEEVTIDHCANNKHEADDNLHGDCKELKTEADNEVHFWRVNVGD